MATLKQLEARIKRLEGKKGSKSKSSKRKVSSKSRNALKKLNRLAKEIQRKHPSWKRTRVMKEAGRKYRR